MLNIKIAIIAHLRSTGFTKAAICRSLSLWQIDHSGPMHTSRFLDVLIADAVPRALVTDSNMCLKYLVTLVQFVPSYTDELWYSETCL